MCGVYVTFTFGTVPCTSSSTLHQNWPVSGWDSA